MQIDVCDLVKRYGDARRGDAFALSIPRLRVGAGETIGLVGNNGAGKTTFLRLALDLLRADEGHVAIGGERVDRSAGWKRHTGAHLDASFLIDFLTPGEFFRFVASTYGLSEAEVQERLARYRSFLGALASTPRYLRDLSTGNRKKVGVVAVLMLRPRLLVLDEPFANLDPRSQIQLKAMLRAANEEDGTTLVLSSHDLLHVTDVCRRVAVLEDGRIVRDEATTEATLRDLEAYFSGQPHPAEPAP